jgi:hypothetical protein
MTEQEVDAVIAAGGYEPVRWRLGFGWSRGGIRPSDVPDAAHALLTGTTPDSWFGVITYPTREAAFADLRQAVRASGTDAA